MKALPVALVILLACSTAHAGVEAVFVKKAMDDKAIVVRANGPATLARFAVVPATRRAPFPSPALCKV
jgi:hypothetical protein